MNENDPAVRVELLGSGQGESDIVMPSGRPSSGSPSRRPAAAMALGVLGLLGGLWWLSSAGSNEDAGGDEPAVVQESQSTTLPTAADLVVADADGPPSGLQLRQLSIAPTHIISGAQGAVFTGPISDTQLVDGQLESPRLGQTVDGSRWDEFATRGIGPDAQIVGLHREDANTLLFVTTPRSAADGGVELVVYQNDPVGQPTVIDDFWTERSRFAIDGFVRTVSARDGQWVAVVDRRAQSIATETLPMQTQFVTGRFDREPGALGFTEVAPDEFVSSFAAIDGGFYATVVRLQLNTVGDAPFAPQLRRWSVDQGWSVVLEDHVVRPGGAPVRLIDAGQNGIFVSFETALLALDPLLESSEWESVADGSGVTGMLDDTFSPETSPALVGEGFLVADTVVGDVESVWISTDGALWQRFDIEQPLRNVSLLQITESGDALVLGESAGNAVFVLLPLGPPATARINWQPAFEPELTRRTIVDGEWSIPVFSAATADGGEFVGLTNQNGSIALTRSSNGLDVETSSPTNFPFGYFTNDMVTTSAGYHVVGQLGLFEDAVFLSADGSTWSRFPIDLPDAASALQIDHFHRSEDTTVVVGSLGWADDLERSELVALWWDQSGRRVRLSARPCIADIIRCSITSAVAVDDGIVATHRVGDGVAVSRWNQSEGWVEIIDVLEQPNTVPSADEATVESVTGDVVRIIGTWRIMESTDAGRTWFVAQTAPPGVFGLFIAASGDGQTAVFANRTDAWLLVRGLWTRFSLERIHLGRSLATADGVSLFSGTSASGIAIIRFGVGP